MSCYHPNTVIETSFGEYIDPKTGEYWPNKKQIKFVKKEEPLEKSEKESIEKHLLEGQRLIELPCGKCDGCKQNYKGEWATRCYLESLEHPYNYMITLTYNEKYAPIGTKGRLSLKKKDFQDFMKRLRITYKRNFNHDEISYKMCSEYGSEENTMRPHYHFIGFNLPIFDLEKFFISETDGQVYKSKILSEIWGMGYVTVIECNWNTCSYVSGYVMKKATTQEDKINYEELGIIPEFSLTSTKPAIGRRYFEKNWKDIYNKDGIYIHKKSKKDNWRYIGQLTKPPRYFDKLLKEKDPELYEIIKAKREENAKANEEMIYKQTNLSKKEYLENRERKHKEALKLIKRRKLKRVG